jgi:hypothetical protein
MAKGRPPPFVTRGKAAAMPARMSRAAASAPPMPPPDEMSGGPPAFRKGGKVGGSFPMGKKAKMPR